MNNLEILRPYLEKWSYLPTRALARMIYNDNPIVFDSQESVRGMLRYYRGSNGEHNRKYAKREFLRDVAPQDNPYSLPDSDEAEYEHFSIPIGNSPTLVLSDVHIPYHSIEAITAAIRWAKDREVRSILLNGDIVDFHKLSRFTHDPSAREPLIEIEMVEEFLFTLKEAFDVPIYYKLGNHDERLETWMKLKAPELYGMPGTSLGDLLHAEKYGVQIIQARRIIKTGKLNILHGHEMFGGGGGVNPARWLFLKTGGNTMCGHFHRTSEHAEPNINGELQACWSIGCLSELHPQYMSLNKWNHGFSRVSFDNDRFKVTNLKIQDGRVL